MISKPFLSSFCLLIFSASSAFAQCSVSIFSFNNDPCEGSDIELFAMSSGTSGNCSYQWSGPNGVTCSSNTLAIPQAPASASGIYSVVLSDDSGCSAESNIEIKKNPKPVVYTGGEAGGCMGSSTLIFAEDVSGNYEPYTYLWENGQTSQEISVTHGGGSYPAPACLITNGFGCAASNNTTFLIYTLPSPAKPSVQASGPLTFCKGGNVTLTTPLLSGFTYKWLKGPNELQNEVNNSLTVSTAGYYKVITTNAFGCTAASANKRVIINPLPPASIVVDGSLNLCNGATVLFQAPQGSYSYQWRKNNVDILNSVSSSYTASSKGYYRVLVTSPEGCSKLSAAVQVTQSCREDGQVEFLSDDDWSVFPSPSNSTFNLKCSDLYNEAILSVTDLTGRVVLKKNISGNEITFGSELGAGIYFANLIIEEQIVTKRIIKTD